jgi:hypothetical protein
MLRVLSVLLLATLPALAQEGEDGPPISITSPDSGVTYAFGTVKSHALVWDKNAKVLLAVVTFIDRDDGSEQQTQEDTHRFRLPGVTFDEAHKVFFATTAKGEEIPIATIKKQLFFSVIQVLPNAVVRILHPRGNLSVILEAVRPNDPALHAPESTSDDGGTHDVDLHSIMQ